MTFSFQCYNCYKFSDKTFERIANSGTLQIDKALRWGD
ncbi:hypothetical protein CHCC14820_2845 [Bacillus paralicheniformis]|uniref:Uncharacterized protein n=1 Tax=Bacillus paralicheniformis TaxID=1648923 RepID=A0A6I7U217_9BACI|nr:hypothetical protein SC10_B2orf01242 [Bacillus paralicheniformis]TWK88040.1 hypothetical protein CHCC20327_2958 [Bacillus licheniformis]OLF92613.1 hypothetical protein B4121_2301 [Bacillus paralicheniformis]OLG03444.1 hypothetical protein B4125_3688 [Bacillus paralicheniformis]OLG03669.1 hypothetical protein B4123_4087 [Bacillus paralicheniformis]